MAVYIGKCFLCKKPIVKPQVAIGAEEGEHHEECFEKQKEALGLKAN